MDSLLVDENARSADESVLEYFSGHKLYGDDFSYAELEQWYEDEKEGFFEMWRKGDKRPEYGSHALNWINGYRHLPEHAFKNILGYGSSYGDEFLPIIKHAGSVTIIEPSNSYQDGDLQGVPLKYIKPTIAGNIEADDNSYTLITAFAALHHVPNVSHVIAEFYRCLVPGGYALIREPIVSMGDWRFKRKGLTKNERGIPYDLFSKIILDAGFNIVNKCKCHHTVINRLGRYLPKPIFNMPLIVHTDRIISNYIKWNNIYHPASLLQKAKPAVGFFVITKPV